MVMTGPKRPPSTRGSQGHARRRRKIKRRARALRVQAKSRKRQARARTSRDRWHARRWWEQAPLELAALTRGMVDAYPGHERGTVGRALLVRVEVTLDTMNRTRRLVLIFPDNPKRRRPIVMADGPTRSRHRFTWARPTSLCLYYARDEAQLRWVPADGIVSLIDLSRLHLIKEAWWRATGEWTGYEKHRRPPSGTEQRPRPPKDEEWRALDRLRRTRITCWCGARRYVACHGAMPEERELQILGLRQADPGAKDQIDESGKVEGP